VNVGSIGKSGLLMAEQREVVADGVGLYGDEAADFELAKHGGLLDTANQA
jgi:hypothetical protein